MKSNLSLSPEFILLGFHLSAEVERVLSCIFSLLYVSNLLANGTILALIWLDLRLHTPMYYYLAHLAIIDISYTSSNFPQIMENLTKHKRSISFVSCVMQMLWYLICAGAECLILVVMSYDRYVAICHPLQYPVIMSWRVCTSLAITSWVCGISLAFIHLILYLHLPHCGPQEVNHIFCEIVSLLKVSCGDTWINNVFVYAAGTFVLVGPISLMLVSYMCILRAILKIQSGEGRKKAFSTCSSHLCVVGLFFGIGIVMYLVPDNGQQDEQKKILSLFYIFFNPVLNPLIYSLRNAQVKSAFNKVLQTQWVL